MLKEPKQVPSEPEVDTFENILLAMSITSKRNF
jgi:hypothetical protein